MARIIVNGEQVGAKSGEEMPVVNPATEEEFDTVPKAYRRTSTPPRPKRSSKSGPRRTPTSRRACRGLTSSTSATMNCPSAA